MGVEVNQEDVNNRAKLIMHRMVARRISRDPSLVDRAARVVADAHARSPGTGYLAEWDRLLGLPVPEVRRLLTGRGETMECLRLSSPFMALPGIDLASPDMRRRIWRMAKRGVVRRAEASSGLTGLAPGA